MTTIETMDEGDLVTVETRFGSGPTLYLTVDEASGVSVEVGWNLDDHGARNQAERLVEALQSELRRWVPDPLIGLPFDPTSNPSKIKKG